MYIVHRKKQSIIKLFKFRPLVYKIDLLFLKMFKAKIIGYINTSLY